MSAIEKFNQHSQMLRSVKSWAELYGKPYCGGVRNGYEHGSITNLTTKTTIYHQEFARVLLVNTPSGPDQSAAIRMIRETVMTANATVALGGRLYTA